MALNYLFNLALTPLFTSLQSVSSPDNAIAILLTIQIIILIIIGLLHQSYHGSFHFND